MRKKIVAFLLILVIFLLFALFLFFVVFPKAEKSIQSRQPIGDSSAVVSYDGVSDKEYPFEKHHSVAVISITMDEDDLWDPEKGIYVLGNNFNYLQQGDEWERQARVELYEPDGRLGFSQNVAIRIHGGATRNNPQKAFKITPKRIYGLPSIYYPVFPDLPYDTYNGLVFRASGNDWSSTMFRDALMQSLIEDFLDTQGYRPAVLYLNGDYWGIYNIRQAYDERYFKNKYGTRDGEISRIEPIRENGGYPEVKDGQVGDELSFVDVMRYIDEHDLSDEAHYNYVSTFIDTDNYRDYILALAYFNNEDSLAHNIEYWRYRGEKFDSNRSPELDGRWRCLLYDTDAGFGMKGAYNDFLYDLSLPYFKDYSWTNRPIQALWTNENFRISFINRYADLLNTYFRADRVLARIEKFKAGIEAEMPEHIERWGGYLDRKNKAVFDNMQEWDINIDVMRNFAEVRPDVTRRNFIRKFNLPGLATLKLVSSAENAGAIRVNTATYEDFSYEPIYFQGVPIEVQAIAPQGYQFVRWEGDMPSEMASMDTVVLTFDKEIFEIKAIFEEASTAE